ncbi:MULTISPECIES: phosphotransferase family protein [Bacillus cereus group]|uniref:Aminoglycoside 6'-acetyltransferase n=1 Tax=Bacillus cereus TaxID=1396 RepID=A0A2B8T060_BACCE|nr:aminoglycoside phosphotransferase family protein [Bacillus cereus]PDY83798.1 aminoglycoside 6'-acetyltransferase [Bacillus cereus]PFA06623.1 aminoglycoside 6'-acetyltransferase [Bacillus cereus]PFM43426.1 aminoglycoside 6'-acetyltransferase [Bacillus cereus]PGL59959.1 aminoglycoside 6'-acetyltransferase [Bacillus cereus]PGQ11786.1 aminoglycoside 6'-acetyltransferase [Bacillus cereus]
MRKENEYVAYLQRMYPQLQIKSVYVNEIGQNNDVLIVNDNIVFRFPKYEKGIQKLRVETKLLEKIRPFITLHIPNPCYQRFQDEVPGKVFTGYEMIEGEPFWKDIFTEINDEKQIQKLACTLAGFLKELHEIPLSIFEGIMQYDGTDTYSEINSLYSKLQEHVYPFMRNEVRKEISKSFELYLNESSHFNFTPSLVHGDFGMTNILYSATKRDISGVIDFGGASMGDPAYDFAGILASYGEEFLQLFSVHYPNLEAVKERMYFYKSTFALQEALFGVLNNDKKAFQAGMAEYV